MKLIYAATLALAGLAGTSALAEVPGGAGTPTVVGAANAPVQDKVICRSAKIIGSRLKASPICKTAKQWEADQMEQRRALEKGQNERTTTGSG